jgi:hypothetical protein
VGGSGFEFTLEGKDSFGKDGAGPLADFFAKSFEIHCHMWLMATGDPFANIPTPKNLLHLRLGRIGKSFLFFGIG